MLDYRLLSPLWQYASDHGIEIPYVQECILSTAELSTVLEYYKKDSFNFENAMAGTVFRVDKKRWINEHNYRMASILFIACRLDLSLFTITD